MAKPVTIEKNVIQPNCLYIFVFRTIVICHNVQNFVPYFYRCLFEKRGSDLVGDQHKGGRIIHRVHRERGGAGGGVGAITDGEGQPGFPPDIGPGGNRDQPVAAIG